MLCVVDLEDVHRAETVRDGITPEEAHLGNFEDGRYAWRLSNVRALRAPLSLKGQQGLFDIDDRLIAGCM